MRASSHEATADGLRCSHHQAQEPPPEDLGSEHQMLLDDIAEAIRCQLDELARAEDHEEEARNFERQAAKHRSYADSARDNAEQALSVLTADAQQILIEAGVVQVDKQVYLVEAADSGIRLRRANLLKLKLS